LNKIAEVHLLYSAAMFVALVVAAPWYVAAAKRRAGLAEKLGRVPERLRARAEGCIWVHAVSVGEVLAVSRLVSALHEQTGLRVVVSTTTLTGQNLAREKFGAENVFYFPFDLPFAIRRYLAALRPELMVLAESEFWPNFVRMSQRSGARVAVVNARISDRSLPRYLRLRWPWRRILRDVDLFLAQTERDADRLRLIGAEPGRVHVTGNLKYDVAAARDLAVVQLLRRRIPAGTDVIVAGSTAEGEEAMLVEAFRGILERRPGALLIIAPRHPERFAAVAALVKSSGVRLWRRSEIESADAGTFPGGVLLLDSIGELASVYGLATVAFVGGSLVPRGGHNILEAAQHGVPIVVGRHTENFRDMVHAFERAQALRVVEPETLTAELLRLLESSTERQQMGRRAIAEFQAQAGATSRTVQHLTRLLRPAAAAGDVVSVQATTR
jgi:3-deoxy-D-manno-octulosonic-acid transferase